MSRLNDRQLAHLLRPESTPEPPPWLLDELRRQIPEEIHAPAPGDDLDGAPKRGSLLPFRRPLPRRVWLAAASVTMLLGGGTLSWLALRAGVGRDALTLAEPEMPAAAAREEHQSPAEARGGSAEATQPRDLRALGYAGAPSAAQPATAPAYPSRFEAGEAVGARRAAPSAGTPSGAAQLRRQPMSAARSAPGVGHAPAPRGVMDGAAGGPVAVPRAANERAEGWTFGEVGGAERALEPAPEPAAPESAAGDPEVRRLQRADALVAATEDDVERRRGGAEAQLSHETEEVTAPQPPPPAALAERVAAPPAAARERAAATQPAPQEAAAPPPPASQHAVAGAAAQANAPAPTAPPPPPRPNGDQAALKAVPLPAPPPQNAVGDAAASRDGGRGLFVGSDEARLSTFALDVDRGSYNEVRRYLGAGRLPPAEAVRVEELVNAFDYGDEAPAEGPVALVVEGAPDPWAPSPGARHVLVRFTVVAQDGELPPGARAEVEVDSRAVVRWRRLGAAKGGGAGTTLHAAPLRADTFDGTGATHAVSAVYALELRPGVAESATVAMLRLRWRPAAGGKLQQVERPLRRGELATRWEAAGRGFRLATVVGRFAELLRDAPEGERAGAAGELEELRRRAAAVGGDAQVKELVRWIDKARDAER
jgi:hypothetical protein